jgi:hypothetical protein
LLIEGKVKKEPNQWNLIIKECGLTIDSDKTVAVRISRKHIRIKVNNTMV